MPGVTSWLTRSVTSSIPTKTFSSRSGALASSSVAPGEEAVAVVVFVRRAQLGQRVGADVVVGHDQPVGRDERPGAAVVEPDGRGPEMLGPAGGRHEAVPRLELRERQVVEDPHPFVGMTENDMASPS